MTTPRQALDQAEHIAAANASLETPSVRVLSVTRTSGMAGQIIITAQVQRGEEVRAAGFSGSAYGSPGPVVAMFGDMQALVSEPDRFGSTFDESWVRAFFGEIA